MKAKWFITFIVLASLLSWVAVTVSAASGAGDAEPHASVAATPPPTINVYNKSGKTIWMYNLLPPYNIPASSGIEIISSTNPTAVTLGQTTTSDGNRIYFVESSAFLPTQNAVNAFNPNDDSGNVGNSFLNYTYLEYFFANDTYTIDLSYIDEWSLPVQMQFHLNGNTTWNKAEDKFTYGFKNFDTVANLLKQNSPEYGGLVWKGNSDWPPYPPPTVRRIIGPNKVWTQQSAYPSGDPLFCLCLHSWVPASYTTFVCGSMSPPCLKSSTGTGIPWNAQTYSKNTQFINNYDFWLNDKSGDPAKTPYPTALHLAAHNDGGGPDKNGKYGFFTYPNDNPSAEFTFIPTTVSLDIFVYGSDNVISSSVIPGGVWHHSSSVLQPLANRMMKKNQRAICVKSGAVQPYVSRTPYTLAGTAATDTFILNHVFRKPMVTPRVKAIGSQGDIVGIDATTLGATSTSVDVVDRALFKRNPSQSQFVYERSTGILYYDQNPSAPGYTGQLCNLSQSSLDLPKLIVYR